MRRLPRFSRRHFELQTHLRSLAAHLARALLAFLALQRRGRREGRAPTGTRGLPREKHTRKRPHSSIQVSPNARPSLRDGRTAYAVLSREPNFPLASLAPRIDDAVRPVGLAHISAKGLTVATTVRTTRFCRTHQRRSSARSLGLTGTTRPARASRARRCRVHRNPARVSNDSRTAPLRRAGLFRLMPQFRISVKRNIFARGG